jgi:hypothetical protein
MAVRYLPNIEWQQVEEPAWGVNNWEMDVARVTFAGPRPKMKAFQDRLDRDRWSVMPLFKTMWLADWSNNNSSQVFPRIDLTYIGFRSGNVPPARPVDGISLQSVQASGTDPVSSDEVSGSFSFKASRTTWTWFERREPALTPRHTTVRKPIDPLTQIQGYSFTNSTGEAVNSIPYSSFVSVFNSLSRVVNVSSYECEMMVPGTIWACRSEIDYMLT